MPVFRAQTKHIVDRQKVQSAPNMELREANAFLKLKNTPQTKQLQGFYNAKKHSTAIYRVDK